MKTNMKIAVFLITAVFTLPTMAEKPQWAGQGKPTLEQKDAHKAAMNAKEGMKGEHERAQSHMKTKMELQEKQRTKMGNEMKTDDKMNPGHKMEKVQKELDKGSEKGMEARKKNKKWWKFWGE